MVDTPPSYPEVCLSCRLQAARKWLVNVIFEGWPSTPVHELPK